MTRRAPLAAKPYDDMTMAASFMPDDQSLAARLSAAAYTRARGRTDTNTYAASRIAAEALDACGRAMPRRYR